MSGEQKLRLGETAWQKENRRRTAENLGVRPKNFQV